MAIRASSTVTIKRIMTGKPPRSETALPHPDPERRGEKYFPIIEQNLCAIIGRADSLSMGESDYGAYAKFHGQFEGKNLLTGETLMAGNCILPPVAEALTLAAVAEAQRNDKNAAINIAFVVGVLDRPLSAVGYEFDVKVLTTATVVDPLAALRAEISGDLIETVGAEVAAKNGLVQLEAPAAPAQVEAPKEPATDEPKKK
jgi:hypothetical protein